MANIFAKVIFLKGKGSLTVEEASELTTLEQILLNDLDRLEMEKLETPSAEKAMVLDNQIALLRRILLTGNTVQR